MTSTATRWRVSRVSTRASGGFTYLGLMFIVALLGIMTAAASVLWSVTSQRDLESELLFVGGEYARAIEAYRRSHQADPQPLPTSLDQLLRQPDARQSRHFLRRRYPDPMTGDAEWGLVKNPAGGIYGIYSLSQRKPLRISGGPSAGAINFSGAKTYQDWMFMASAVAQVPGAGNLAVPTVEDKGEPAPYFKFIPADESDNQNAR